MRPKGLPGSGLSDADPRPHLPRRLAALPISIAALLFVWTVAATGQVRDIVPQARSGGAEARTHYGDSWAVVIGINEYQHPRIPKLRYAVNDARAIERELTAQGFRREHVITLVNQQATKATIERVLGDDLRTRLGREDRLLVFFAGHGKTDRLRSGEEEGYLIPVDGDPSRLFSSAISMTALRQISDRLPPKHILYVVDACYSGYALFTRAITDDLFEELIKKPAIQILTAGRQEDQAQERGGHGVFTQVLLQGLRGDAFGRKGWLSLEELGVWVKQRVYAESNKQQVPQYGNISGQGQFVFFRQSSEVVKAEPEGARPQVRQEVRQDVGSLAVTARVAGAEVWLGNQKIGETQGGHLIVVSDLAPGVYRLVARKGGYRDWQRDVNVSANSRTEAMIELEPSPAATPATKDAGAEGSTGKAIAALPQAPDFPSYPGISAKALGTDRAPMLFIPAGPFLMGAADDDLKAAPSEKPQRTITLAGYWIDRLEASNAQYRVFRDATRYRPPSLARDPRFNGPNQPVVGVSWDDATAYCRWAGKRLPTEAEWEKAARGTDGRLFPWGNAYADETFAQVMAGQPADVGARPKGASPYGLLDAAGNVWEWVHDWYDHAAYRKEGTAADPKGPAIGGEKVLRGGSWWERDFASIRVTARHHQPPDRTHNNVGFRCAMSGTAERSP